MTRGRTFSFLEGIEETSTVRVVEVGEDLNALTAFHRENFLVMAQHMSWAPKPDHLDRWFRAKSSS